VIEQARGQHRVAKAVGGHEENAHCASGLAVSTPLRERQGSTRETATTGCAMIRIPQRVQPPRRARHGVVSQLIVSGSHIGHVTDRSKDSPMTDANHKTQFDSINHMLAERRMAARSVGIDDAHVLELARQRRAQVMTTWFASLGLGYRRGRAIVSALAPVVRAIGLIAAFAVLILTGGASALNREPSATVPGMHWSHFASSLFW